MTEGGKRKASADLIEIFSGIQGEGLHVGRRHVLVRLAGCNLACRFCDQPESRERTDRCAVERRAGLRDFEQVANPVTADAAATFVRRLDAFPGLHQAVALTGGEPLLRPDFILALAHALRDSTLPFYLDTNGTLPDAMAQVAPVIAVACLDVKLPSAAGVSAETLRLTRACVLAAAPCERFLKVVVAAATTAGELTQALSVVLTDERVPVVLQPVTSTPDGPEPPSPGHVLALQETAKKVHPGAEVRVIPQTHKLMGQR